MLGYVPDDDPHIVADMQAEIDQLQKQIEFWKLRGKLPPEPTVEEVWDGGRGEYVTEVTFASGAKYTIVQARSGAFVGEFEIYGPRGDHPESRTSCSFYRDGFSSPEKAIDYLTDPERRDW
jgi:hypothetical protein